jgi:hypothetical protein
MTRHSPVDKLAKDALPDEFIDRFAIVGPLEHTAFRLKPRHFG